MLQYIIKINGIYDIICALSILFNIPYIKNIHLSMIKDYNKQNKITERFFAYWIFTYGIIRISDNYLLISYSYYIEALVFINEYMNNSTYFYKSLFVIISSLFLGYFAGRIHMELK